MKFRKLISMLLSLVMIASCFVAVPFTAQASETVAPLTNLIPQGDMENGEVAGLTAVGTMNYVKDAALTGNADNHVLEVDGSSASSSATKLKFGNLVSMEAGHKYWFDFDYKVAYAARVSVRISGTTKIASSTTTANTWYRLSDNINTGVGFKDNVFTATEATKLEDVIVGTSGVKNTKLYIDNLEYYDITNAVEITANVADPAKFMPVEGLPTIGGKLMANKGSVAKFKVESKVGYIVSAVVVNGETLSPNDEGVYSFTVAESGNTISATTKRVLTNLIPDGNMEGETVTFTGVGTLNYITDVALTGKANNHVLEVDGSSASGSATKLTLGSALTPMEAGRTYWLDFDYKVASAARVTVRINGTATVASSTNTANTWYRLSENINTGVGNKSNIYTATDATKFDDIVVGTGVKNTKLYVDNLEFYDITDAVEITSNAGDSATFVPEDGFQTIGGKLMANKGEVVKFKVESKVGYPVTAVAVNGATLSPDAEGVYSFTVAERGNAVTVTTGREIVNLIPKGDMVDDTFTFAGDGGEIGFDTDEALTGDPENKVLKIDGSAVTEGNSTRFTIKDLTKMEAGHKYWFDFDYKVGKTTNIRVRNKDYGNQIVTEGGTANVWYRLSEMCDKGENIVTAAEDTFLRDIYVDGNTYTTMYFDNLVLYDITGAYEIELPRNATITDGGFSLGNADFAFAGDTVSFTIDGTPNTVFVNEDVVTATGDTYSFTMPQSDVTVLAVNGQTGENNIKYAVAEGKPYAIFDEAATVTLIVAGYTSNGKLTEAYIGTVTGVAGQKLDLTTVAEFSDVNWADKTIFTFDNLTNLTPYRSACDFRDL